MKRSILTADQTDWLSDVFARNRALYGGLRMEEGSEGDGGEPADGDKQDEGKPDDKPSGELGENGKKALDAERDARKAAEDQVKALKTEFDGFKSALTDAFGIKAKDGDGADALAAVQQQLAAMQHESAVLKLANEHKITDAKDLEILATAKDSDSMKTLAERLAPAEQEQDGGGKPRPPRPKVDKAQGGGNKSKAGAKLTGLGGNELYDRLHPKPASS